jgi:hypothetical protein
MGACHGNLNGKGGFKLSLRGEDPEFDFLALSREMHGRRLNAFEIDQSLLLKKATGQVPHEGSIRFSPDSPEFRILADWIRSGMPREPIAQRQELSNLHVSPSIEFTEQNQVPIKVLANFNGEKPIDVTHLAWFEVGNVAVARVDSQGVIHRLLSGETVILVRYLDRQIPVRIVFLPQGVNFAFQPMREAKPIDRFFNDHWKARHINPSRIASDSLFLRRIYLDLLGLLPTPEETKAFLASTTSNKRSILIDQLLTRPEFADHWALKWSDLLRNEEKSLDRKGVRVFHQWIREAIHEGKPFNEFAKEIVTGLGSSYANPESNFYRAVRDPYSRAESVAQVFLGVRIGCAKCHNHPFDRWKQDDYHQFAAIFSRIDYRILSNDRRDNLDKHEFNGEQIVYLDPSKTLLNPRNNQKLQPRLLGDATSHRTDEGIDFLGDWLANQSNPFFAPAQVNRVWLNLFGKGIVDPNDDFRSSNPPVEPKVLDYLVGYFREKQFDLRALIREIVTSNVYQLDSETNPSNVDDEFHFSHARIIPLKAEALLDGIQQVLDVKSKIAGYPNGTRHGQVSGTNSVGRRGDPSENGKFLKVFGKPERLLTCECERSEDAGLIQAFHLLNGAVLQKALKDPQNRFRREIESGKRADEILSELYLAAFSRQPNQTEKERLLSQLNGSSKDESTWEDIVWAMVNSKEFLLRR